MRRERRENVYSYSSRRPTQFELKSGISPLQRGFLFLNSKIMREVSKMYLLHIGMSTGTARVSLSYIHL